MKNYLLLILVSVFVLSCSSTKLDVHSKDENEKDCICTLEYAPVCANGIIFSNTCHAKCEGYTDDEIKPAIIIDDEPPTCPD